MYVHCTLLLCALMLLRTRLGSAVFDPLPLGVIILLISVSVAALCGQRTGAAAACMNRRRREPARVISLE